MGVEIQKTPTIIIRNDLDKKSLIIEPPIYNFDFAASPPQQDNRYCISIRPYFQMNGLRFQTQTQYYFTSNPSEEYFLLLCSDLISNAQLEFTIAIRKELDNPSHLVFFPKVIMKDIIERIKTAFRINSVN